MSVLERHDPWMRGMRRRQGLNLGMWASVSALLAFVAGILVVFGDARWNEPQGAAVLLIVVLWLLQSGYTTRSVYVLHTLSRLVPQLEGRVCPRCRLPLEGTREALTCPRCARTFSPSRVASYWENFALAPERARLSEVQHGGRRTPGRAWLARHRRMLSWLTVLIVVLLAVAVHAAWTRSCWLNSAAGLAPNVLYGACIGAAIQLWAARRQRTGDSLHCAKCGYQKAPSGELSPTCPECGSDWHRFGGTVSGARVAKNRQLVAILVLLVCAALLIAPATCGWSVSRLLMQLVPTAALIHDASNGRYPQRDAWARVAGRGTGVPFDAVREA